MTTQYVFSDFVLQHPPTLSQDSDFNTRTPKKNLGYGASGGLFAGSVGAGGLLPADLAAAAGTPSNLGKVGDACTLSLIPRNVSCLYAIAALADTDPLGVNQNVTFDEVGGLDDCVYYTLHVACFYVNIAL